jgi:TP901 family phage tail tape measure protein
MPIQIPVVQTGLERSIQEAATKAGKNLRINMGPGAKSIDALSQPLGRLTGKADEFTKSMEAANARVLAFGASVGVIAAVSRGFQELVRTTIDVEKNLANINSILKQSESQLNGFKDTIFDIARNTGQTFGTVAEAALELSRQGLKAEEVTKRLNDALVLSRLSGLSAADSVSGLTAAINSFSSAGLTSEQVLNKISAAAASAAVSDRDLIEGLKRSGSVAVASGVQFDELIGIIGALQERTARGGAVIGNSLKTIFVRIQDIEKLKTLQELGVQVTDLEGKVLSSSKVIENLAPVFAKLDQASKVNLADDLVGKFQIAPFLALLEDYNLKVSRSGEIAATSFNATNEAYQRNEALSKTLAAAINTATVNLKELANALGEIGVTENLSKIIGVFNSVVSSIQGILDGDGIGSKFAKGLIKGIGSIIAGPGLALALVAIGKLLLDFAKFGSGALKTFFGLNAAAEAQRNLQGQIAASLLNDKGIRSAMLSIEKQNISEGEKKKLQTLFFTKALNEQLMLMKKMQGIAISIAPGVMAGTASARGGGRGRAAGGFLPIGAERSDISKGVGGSPSSAKPVVIPNFAFGGGRRGTMVANDSEYIVPNYANGGDAIFNQNMASSMGLPANARKVRAASGYIPNFANFTIGGRSFTTAQISPRIADGTITQEQAAKAGYLSGKDKEALKNKNKTAKIVNVDAKRYGVASVFPAKKTADSKTSPTQLASDLAKAAAQQGITDIRFKGIQVRSLHDAGDNLKKKKNEFKNQIADLFVNPVAQLGANIIGASFQDNDKADLKAEVDKVKTKGAVDLFSSSVEGGIFESAIRLITKKTAAIKAFGQEKDDQMPFDFEEGAGRPSEEFQKTFKFKPHVSKADAKRTASNDAVRSVIAKAFNSKDQRGFLIEQIKKTNPNFKPTLKAAGGYIPNFAEGALENAIGREKGAGLPVSQIRINQSGKLRNSQNPMGLAVTNTRDEPTGAIPAARGFIPNYSSPFPTGTPQHPTTQQLGQVGNAAQGGDSSSENQKKSTNEVTKANRDYLGTIFAVQAGLTALSAATNGSTSGLGKFTSILSGSLSSITGFVFAASAINTIGKNIQEGSTGLKAGLGGFVSKLAVGGAVIAGAFEVFKLGKSLYQEFSGANKRTAQSLAVLSDITGKLTQSFDDLDAVVKLQNKNEAEDILKGLVVKSESLSGVASGLVAVLKGGFTSLMGGQPEYVGDVIAGETNLSFETEGLKEGVLQTLTQFKNLGYSTEFLENKLKKFGESVDSGEATSFFKDLAIADKAVQKYKKSLEDLSNTDLAYIMQQKDFIPLLGQKKEDLPSSKALEGFIKEENNKRVNVGKINPAQFDEVKSQIQDREAKILLDTELKLAELRMTRLTQAEKDLALGQAKGQLTKEQIRDVERIIELNSIEQDFNKDLIGKIRERVFSVKGVVLDEEKVISLMGKISALTGDQIQDEEKLREIIGDTEDLTGKKKELYEVLVENIIKEVAEAKKLKDATKEAKDEAINLKNQTAGIKDDFGDAAENARHLSKMMSLSAFSGVETSKSSLEDEKQRLARISSSGGLTRGESENLERMQKENDLQLARLRMRELEISYAEKINNINQGLDGASPEDREKANNSILEAAKTFENEKKALENSLRRLEVEVDIVTAIKKANNELDRLNKTSGASPAMKFEAQMNVDALTKFPELTESEAIARYKETMSAGEYFRSKNLSDPEKSASDLGKELVDGSMQFAHNIGNAMVDAIAKGQSLGDALLGTAAEFLNIISKAFMNKAVNDMMGMFSPTAPTAPTVGRASGGPISGGSGHKDDIPAMLMGGEFVMNKKSVKKYGMGFMSALNNGSLQGFASGGQVRDEEGMFTTPGMNGAGAIKGAANLLSFATQTPVALNRDTITSSGAFLDAESGRMTMFGKRNNPEFQKVQDAKQQAFDLYASEMNARQQAKDQEKANKKALMESLKGAAISAAVSAGVSSMASGYKAGSESAGGSWWNKFKGGTKGMLFGGNEIGGQSYGGLTNILSGTGFMTGPPKAIRAYDEGFSGSSGSTSKGGGFGGFISKGLSKIFSSTADPNQGYNPTNPVYGTKSGLPEGGDYNDFPVLGGRYPLLPNGGEYNPPTDRKATGGLIPAAGGVDTVPAMLSGGEFVMNAAATRNIGADNLQSLNSGSGSSDNAELVSKLDELIIATGASKPMGDINITINGSAGTESKEEGKDSSDRQRDLSEKIKTVVKQVIADEQRLGGQLRK